MKNGFLYISVVVLLLVKSATGFPATWPFAPAAGQTGSTAVHLSDNRILAWADGYTNALYGGFITPNWKTPQKALGPAEGTVTDIVCLGRGGQITMTFSQGIADGAGYDFAVFENAFDDYFLELAWVEVSSDGSHFVRFPNYSYTTNSTSVLAFNVYGLASKYRQAYGTPFDLSELQAVSNAIAVGGTSLSDEYVTAFTNNYPFLDPAKVSHVRLIDIVGDGSAKDAEGFEILDPYPTSGSAGLDLDAIAVLNQPPPVGLVQQISFDEIPHQKLSFGSINLDAESDSGLPVFFTLQSGPAALSGNLLTFTGTGIVEVVARQGGDATYAPAAPVLRSFHVADVLQHIFVEQVPNQLPVVGFMTLRAQASSGLPVYMEVYDGPESIAIGPTNHILSLSGDMGSVILRAYQPGDSAVAPAEDVFIDFEIVAPASSNAPIAFPDWLSTNAVSVLAVAIGKDSYGREVTVLEYDLDRRAAAFARVQVSADLEYWTNAVPEILEQHAGGSNLHMQVQCLAEETNAFYRLEFTGQ